MAGGRLVHEMAIAGATALLDVAAAALRPEERREFFNEAYRVFMAMLGAYGQQTRWEAVRLYKPSNN